MLDSSFDSFNGLEELTGVPLDAEKGVYCFGRRFTVQLTISANSPLIFVINRWYHSNYSIPDSQAFFFNEVQGPVPAI